MYTRELIIAIRAAISSKGPPSTVGIKGRVKRRKKEISETIAQSSGKPAPGVRHADSEGRTRQVPNWGVLEPLRAPLGPYVDTIRPLMTTNVVLSIMSILLVVSYFRPYHAPSTYSRSRSSSIGQGYPPGMLTPERMAAYEELWRQEESSLWDWLDERVGGLDRLVSSSSSASSASLGQSRRENDGREERGFMGGKQLQSRLAEERMSERQVREAIRLTQQRLDELRSLVDKPRDGPD